MYSCLDGEYNWYRLNLFFTEFVLFVLMSDSISKLIYNRCTFKLTTAAYEETNEQSRLWFRVLIRYFVVLDIHLFVSVNIHQC